MAKAPVAGRVKTRLCPPCSPEEAAEVAAAALADTLQSVARCGAERRVVALDGEPGDWLPPGFAVVAQSGGSFNERLRCAWATVRGPCLQIGMDTPQVTPGLLDDAMAAIRPGFAQLGPAYDGGWWALGLATAQPGAFDGVPMSTSHTCRHQRRRLQQLGMRVEHLPTLRDIDRFDDALEVAGSAPETATSAAVRRLADSAG